MKIFKKFRFFRKFRQILILVKFSKKFDLVKFSKQKNDFGLIVKKILIFFNIFENLEKFRYMYNSNCEKFQFDFRKKFDFNQIFEKISILVKIFD